jgi:hypothetical protein
MQYAIEYDVYGEHRARVHKEGEGKDAKLRVERVGDEAGAPDVNAGLPLHQMHLLWALAKDLEKRNRQIPITKKEAETFISKSHLKKLINAGLLKEAMLTVFKDGKKGGARSCIVMTELGRRYCRSIDEKVSGNATGSGSDSLGSLAGERESSSGSGQEAQSSAP